MSTRLKLVPPSEPSPRKPALAGTTRLLLLKLSEERRLTLELARVRAEIAPLARAFADAQGEFVRPTIGQLRQRLGIASGPTAGAQQSEVAQ